MLYIKKNNHDIAVKLDKLKKKYKTYNVARKKASNEIIDIRMSLISEQHGLCCYCCGKIVKDRSHIEHIKPQSKYPSFSLEYNNILASCMGYKDDGCNCGHAKENNEEDIVLPIDDDCELLFDYSADGRILGLTDKANNTIKVLNLNRYELVEARAAIIKLIICCDYDIVKLAYQESENDEWQPFSNITRCFLKKYANEWDKFKEYFNVTKY